ncbi:argininosuccinate lyase [Peptostreptococcus faecalis]|uniref:argininosuccinate lyase n=1 Tax=Peptostreptococcus faecalis TaxID=2045015 RepID=UPI000C79B712|nr:argininosuccinate lyase [Peptostreptococcus faecalis]
MQKLWGGRFKDSTSEIMDEFNASIRYDWKLYKYDIKGSIAHARMLGKTGIISEDESKIIISALEEIESEIDKGNIEFSVKHEDIHMNIENILTNKIGDLGKKLHTARSRNDQVALDVRMYSRDKVEEIQGLLLDWIKALVEVAKENIYTVIPGYTHLQIGQPISLAHLIMAHAEMAKRDYQRLSSWMEIHNTMPLGSGALAGTTFPIDRYMTSNELGFDGPCANSMDGVSDRDYIIDLLSAASTGMMHLSRLCEEIIIWSTQEFHFVELDDAYSTGSSMMPQKKNPDAAELIRGKVGRVYGDLNNILTVMKGLPLAYNKDMQEDKECLFDGVETWEKCIKIMIPMLKTMKVCKDTMLADAKKGFSNATDLADYLTKKGVAFRDSHKITGEIVLDCIDKNISLDELPIEEYKKYSDLVEEDIYDTIDVFNCMENRISMGATSSKQVKVNIESIESFIKLKQYR